MILTGEIENELHELLYFVRNHKEPLKSAEKVQVADMLAVVEARIRYMYDITSVYFIPAEEKAAKKIVAESEKAGDLHVY